ncbi:CBS domain-containing protein [Bacillaceae bacterium Marseille-Q3522]|nr:CBS domain-containing protein [Bacillaceae bacterium Marseille-Q3522]
MFVKSIMIPKNASITVGKSEPLNAALTKMNENHLEGLPVLNGKRYVGIITRFGIYEAFFQSDSAKNIFLENSTVEELTTHQNQYLNGVEIFENTLLDLKDFPLLAVVGEDREFLGIVTRFDVLEQFQSAFGTNRSGVRIAITSVEAEGRIARLSNLAIQYHQDIISLVTFDETDKLVRRIVVKVAKNEQTDKFFHKLEESGFRILHIYDDQLVKK